ncbi:hypothetical protein PGT21_024735 [Puccinia graminis f. sp. tritici]|uniref:Uncharacterized protein n=1 Tax=Puccinia graminis f. sp. tritici TaxID=56615 RepID=A0A5B0NVV3_PUCGR|nr:hypothetical protein PGT21_024735 [Puccinia graminis f. sp. tritici]KAA1127720.1 hypothetical protein PGTUg99_003241 [Puccinia graminis f. sp. tritici]
MKLSIVAFAVALSLAVSAVSCQPSDNVIKCVTCTQRTAIQCRVTGHTEKETCDFPLKGGGFCQQMRTKNHYRCRRTECATWTTINARNSEDNQEACKHRHKHISTFQNEHVMYEFL